VFSDELWAIVASVLPPVLAAHRADDKRRFRSLADKHRAPVAAADRFRPCDLSRKNHRL